jgi:peptide/nickel transport system permease protein
MSGGDVVGWLGAAASRLAAAAGSAAAVVLLAFLIFRVLPGDPAASLVRDRAATAEQVAHLRAGLGLDRPLPVQFHRYVTDLTTGDLGTSYLFHRPVAEVVAARVGPTLLLVGTATLAAAVLGLWLGVHAGWRPGSRLDRTVTAAAVALWSTPAFWLGLVLMVVLGAGAGPLPPLLPLQGMATPGTSAGSVAGVLDIAAHLVLPAVTLVLAQLAQYLLVARSAVADQLDRGYLRLARATGLRDAQVRRGHAVPNALLPVLAVLGTNLGTVVAGVVTVETVFSWPGLGRLMYEALTLPDLPLLHALFLLAAGGVVAANALVDGAARLLDPRTGLR